MNISEVDHHHPFYPITPPLEQGHLQVSNIHALYYATYGNPNGTPVVVLHGGPGAGCQESTVKLFNPSRYHIILFDQRGAMRSTPFGSIEENTTHHLIEDIEKLRKHLNIDRWVIFGGSWGSALGLLYGQAYPERCLSFILRGINLLRAQDYHHLLYGMGKIFPDAYAPVLDLIPQTERANLFAAYHKRVFSPDPTTSLTAAKTLQRYTLICSTHLPDPDHVDKALQNDKNALSISKQFLNYSVNHFFIEENQILQGMPKIAHIPAYIIHGRWDAICLPEMAYLLHKEWPGSTLWIVSQGGHSGMDPAIAASLATATDLYCMDFK